MALARVFDVHPLRYNAFALLGWEGYYSHKNDLYAGAGLVHYPNKGTGFGDGIEGDGQGANRAPANIFGGEGAGFGEYEWDMWGVNYGDRYGNGIGYGGAR